METFARLHVSGVVQPKPNLFDEGDQIIINLISSGINDLDALAETVKKVRRGNPL